MLNGSNIDVHRIYDLTGLQVYF